MHSSYFIPLEKVMKFMADAAMNSMEGVYVYGLTDPSVKRLLPPPLEPADPACPLAGCGQKRDAGSVQSHRAAAATG